MQTLQADQSLKKIYKEVYTVQVTKEEIFKQLFEYLFFCNLYIINLFVYSKLHILLDPSTHSVEEQY